MDAKKRISQAMLAKLSERLDQLASARAVESACADLPEQILAAGVN